MNAKKNREFWAVAATIGSCLIFGFSFMATRVAMMHTAPHMLLALRFFLAFLVMTVPLVTGIEKMHWKGKPMGRFFLLGLCEPVLYFIAETNGIRLTNSSFAGVMIALIPVATAVLSAVVQNNALRTGQILWIACSVAGVALLSFSQSESGAVSMTGFLYLLGAITAASVFPVLNSTIADAFSPFERTYITMLMGMVAFVGYALVQEGKNFFPAAWQALRTPQVLGPVVYLGILSSVVAYYLTNYGLTYLNATRVSAFSNIIPIVSVLAGVLVLGEPFSPLYVAGIFLILLGVRNVNRSYAASARPESDAIMKQ